MKRLSIRPGYMLASLTALVLMVSAVSAFAVEVKVRSAVHDGYGRIVFNWPSPVPFTASASGDRLVVRFSDAIEANYTGVVRSLQKYISAAEPGADGRSVSFTLKGDFGVRSFDMGAAAIVDVIDNAPKPVAEKAETPAPAAGKAPAAKSAPAAKPAAAQAWAGTGPTVKVRTGLHEKYTRIVFDWPSKVGYQLDQNGGQTTIRFARPAQLSLGNLQRRPPKFISSASTSATDDGVEVVLGVSENSKIRHFLSGPKVVVDVMAPSETTQATAAPKPAAKKVAEKAPAADKAPAATPASVAKKPEAPKKLSIADAIKKAKEKINADATGTTPAEAPAPDAVPVSPVQQAAATASPTQPSKPTALTPPPTALTPPASASKARDSSGMDTSAFSQLSGVQIVDGSQPAAAMPGGPKAPLGSAGGNRERGPSRPMKAQAVGGGVDSIGIRIDWDEPVAAAVFRRADYLWGVFDKPTAMDVEELRTAGGNIIRSIEQVPNERATLLRLSTVTGINPDLKRDGLAWILEFRKQPLAPKTVIETTAQPNSPIGARLFLPVTEPGNAITLTDPEVGDSLVVVPVIPLGYGIATRYDYPQARILPSSQGLAFQPRSDDLRVRPLRQGVEVTSSSGLKISAVSADIAAGSKLGEGVSMRQLTRMFDLEKWRDANIEIFTEEKLKFQDAIVRSKKTGLEKARMDLANFYFANGFGAEALGVLKIISENRPAILETADFKGMKGAINVTMGRYGDAHGELDAEVLKDNDEARFWRAALRAYEDDIFGAAPDLRRMGVITRPYPRPLKIPLEILIAEAAVQLGDIKQATRYLEALKAAEPNPAQKSQINFVFGRLRELSGDFDGAVGVWEEVMEGPHRPSRAKAAVSRTELLLKLKKIDAYEAITELEKLRFAWRGDEFEFKFLRRLGDLYLEVGDYRNGLRTLRQAATHFRDNPKAPEITQQMTDSFANLYLEDDADSLPPVTAIALYDEFKELTPPGELGDEMIRKLADRLVDVDLLDRAAALLQGQVEFRLEGQEKSRVGAQLALVHVIAVEYEQALDALDATFVADPEPELEEQRRHLRARALMGMDSDEEALALLKDDKSINADLLRTEIFWNGKDWVQASISLRRLARSYGAKPKEPVDEKQGQTILNLAVAMTLSGNERGIDRLRRDYGEAMDEGPFRDAFRLIASPQSFGLIDYASIAGKVADVENFQSFMEAFQERLKEQKLSSIN
ncbi:MAG: hypothetical protein HOC60_07340 [Rhodospirillaceae bacterium]|nr:hypothetical protein [Rhodospirillaceae bacterium]